MYARTCICTVKRKYVHLAKKQKAYKSCKETLTYSLEKGGLSICSFFFGTNNDILLHAFFCYILTTFLVPTISFLDEKMEKHYSEWAF